MKTDWNETFRFDEEETELAQNTIETYESVKREFIDVDGVAKGFHALEEDCVAHEMKQILDRCSSKSRRV